MKEVEQDIDPITTRNDLADFLSNPENAQRIDCLVEDIRYALMEYQVCVPKALSLIVLTTALGFVATRHLRQELPRDRESRFLVFQSFLVICE